MRLIPIGRDGTPRTELPLSDLARAVCSANVGLYDMVGYTPPWIAYLAVTETEIVGTCAFKSPPRDGPTEIAYFTFPDHEGRGFATKMATELIAIAAAAAPDVVITAQTLPQENASTSVLKRLGFRYAGSFEHPEDGLVWEWHREPAAGESGGAPTVE